MRWAKEITEAEVPHPDDVLAKLTPPAMVQYATQLVASTVDAWQVLSEAIQSAGQDPPEWVVAVLGGCIEAGDTLAELLAYMDAYVPAHAGGEIHGHGTAAGNGNQPAADVIELDDHRPDHIDVPKYCNAMPPDGEGPACLNDLLHVDMDRTPHNNGKRTWPEPEPEPAPVDPAWQCTICGVEAMDMHEHEAKFGHWPTFGGA